MQNIANDGHSTTKSILSHLKDLKVFYVFRLFYVTILRNNSKRPIQYIFVKSRKLRLAWSTPQAKWDIKAINIFWSLMTILFNFNFLPANIWNPPSNAQIPPFSESIPGGQTSAPAAPLPCRIRWLPAASVSPMNDWVLPQHCKWARNAKEHAHLGGNMHSRWPPVPVVRCRGTCPPIRSAALLARNMPNQSWHLLNASLTPVTPIRFRNGRSARK